jgi:hypothetical protein
MPYNLNIRLLIRLSIWVSCYENEPCRHQVCVAVVYDVACDDAMDETFSAVINMDSFVG